MSASDGGHAPSLSTISATTATTATTTTTRDHLKGRVDGTNSTNSTSRPLLVDVGNASRVLECSRVERQIGFQHLVRHYLSQILYGCKNPSCSTPSCLSCQKRIASRPVRPPTQLTARALAHYLANQNHSQRQLCPHELKVLPSSLAIHVATGTATRTEAIAHADAIKKRHQTRKDAKSLSQNLYDSVTMICAYSNQLPNPSSLLQSLRSPTRHPSHATTVPREAVLTEPQKRPDASQHVAAIVHSNRESVAPRANGRARIASTSLKVLDSGQQVHRIPYYRPEPTRLTDQTLLDKGHDHIKPSNTKTRKKSFTLSRSVTEKRHTLAPSETLETIQSVPSSAAPIDPMLPVLSSLNCDILEEMKSDLYSQREYKRHGNHSSTIINGPNHRLRTLESFVDRSLFYALSDTETLIKSFHDANGAFEASPLSHLNSIRLTQSFRDWHDLNGPLIFDSLWVALGALFIPPPQLQKQRSSCPTSSRKGASTRSSSVRQSSQEEHTPSSQRYINNNEAAHIAMICIHALTSSVHVGLPRMWPKLRSLRACGTSFASAIPLSANDDGSTKSYLRITDELEYEPAVRLADRLLCALGTRSCFQQILATIKKQGKEDQSDDECSDASVVGMVVDHLNIIELIDLANKQYVIPDHSEGGDPGWTMTATFVEWLKTIIVKRWDTKPEINKWSSVGASIMILDELRTASAFWNRLTLFRVQFVHERLDKIEEPLKYLRWTSQPNTFHVLQYPFLFHPDHLVEYFRTINLTSMMQQYDHTARTHQMSRSLEPLVRGPHWMLIRRRMAVTMSDCLVLDVSREDTFKDTLNRLWGLEKRMLLKPLKVKMGQHEGEVGADHGGVTYEFFRVVLSEAFKPDHGMFTLDSNTRMTWFQPNTLEPDWKFEMIGVLFSLAIYNGVTLPVTFPIVLYAFLHSTEAPSRPQFLVHSAMEDLREGWPDLFKGFEQLLAWTDGDVGDVFMREYAFSYQAFGQRIDHNMEESYVRPRQATPNSPAIRPEDLLRIETKEAKLVTNENRRNFVCDYIHHLTYLSVSPQLHAFKKGFLACLQPKSLQLFRIETLRWLVEGEQNISIPELRRCTRYEEGYSATHPTIQNFWAVAEEFNQDDCRHLLEFVTASDRVPITGYKGITFLIIKGGDVQMLPTSSTCFGKLFLPDYKDKESLRSKLELAIRNSKGFGVV
ncbi:hypothetical protein GQ44DRAFT_772488 [Phaeosphaeriaceae sp. PMI808]|nr:hypothetical protein GQ44DRAFT_772488 [Phaeosphaeriaceae sp. PMI808]